MLLELLAVGKLLFTGGKLSLAEFFSYAFAELGRNRLVWGQ